MPADAKAICTRYDRLWNDAATHFRYCDEMAPYLAPSRSGILTKRVPGDKQTRQVYDSTSTMAAELCAHFVAGQVINPSQLWGAMTLRHPRKRAQDTLNEWLEESRDRMLTRLSQSMFYAEAVESKIDWVGFGTGFLLREELPQPVNRTVQGFRGFRFEAVKTGRFVTAEGSDGLIDTMYRCTSMSARQLVDRFGKNAVSEKVRQCLVNEKPDDPFDILHAVYPRSLADQRYAAGAQKMPWASCWVEKDAKHLIFESGYRTFPGAIYRYTKTPGETFGRGRGHLAFPDTWTLNQAKHLALDDWALKISPPPLVAHDSVIGTLRLRPGTPTVINTRGRSIQDVIQPYQTGSRPEVSQIKEEELRKSIRQIFFVDQILMLMEVNKSEMTAEEWRSKIGLLFKIMGPVYGRVEHEFLRQIWDGVFDEMMAAGEFSDPPDEIYETDGQIDTAFQNPIARAQRRGDVEAMVQTIQDLAGFAPFAPQVYDRFDPEKSATMIAEINGYPARATRNDEEMEALAQARQEQQAQEQQLAAAGQIASAAGDAAPMLTALQGGKSA
jgi:hypothetical protein